MTQDDDDKSAIGWGTYDWRFRRERDMWRIGELVITVLTMTTLDRGWRGRTRSWRRSRRATAEAHAA